MAKKIEAFYEALGSRIQEERKRRRMTQAQLGACLVPQSTRASIANIENGKQRVLVHTLVQLANTLESDVPRLLPTQALATQRTNPSDVEHELKRKLNLSASQLKKLTAAADPTSPKDRNKK
jgi:transcriptional regulator with XRE-family HTH domain